MKKKLFKIVVGGLTTISLILSFCFINVNASSIDDYAFYYSRSEYFNNYANVDDYDDLKGTIWHFNVNLYELSENYSDTQISLRFLQNVDTNSIFDLPFFLQLRSDYIYTEIGYPIYNNRYVELNIAPLCSSNVGDAITINTNYDYGSVFIKYYDYTLREFEGSQGNVITNEVNNVINDGDIYQSYIFFTDDYYDNDYLDISLNPQLLSTKNYIRGSSELYLFFPNTDYTIEDYNSTDDYDFNFLEILLRYSTRVVFPYQYFLDKESEREYGFIDGYNRGYNSGYYDGYDDAQLGNDDSYRFPFLTGVFNAVSDILNLEIFPNVKLSYFVFIPLVLGITGMIFWFWRRD